MASEAVRAGYHTLERRDVLSLVPDGDHNVLDIGGGVGLSAAYLKTCGKAERATVVDLVGDKPVDGIDASYGGDLEDLSLLRKVQKEEGPFDVILCLDVLEHLKDPWSVVEVASEMLNPGGVLVVSVPNVRNYRLVLPLVFGNSFRLADSGILDRTHLRWFVRDTAEELVTSGGLRIDHVTEHFDGPRKKLFDKLTFGVFRGFLVIQFFLRARKAD